MWPALISAAGSLISGWLSNKGAENAAGQLTGASAAALDEQKRQFNTFLQLLAPQINSENSRRGVADAFLGVPSSGGGGILVPGQYGNTVPTDISGLGPQAAKQSSLPSLSGATFNSDHSPSLYGRYVEGAKNGESEGQFALNGGASVSASLANDLTNWTAHNIGLKGPSEVLGRALGFQPHATAAYDQFGTPQDNAPNAEKYDYAGYGNATDLKRAFEALNDRDKSFIAKSYGYSGGGDPSKLTLGEFTQWWAERTDDGKAAMARGEFKTPTQAQAANGSSGGILNMTPGADGTYTLNSGAPTTQSQAIDMWKASPFYTAALSGFDKDRSTIQGSAATGGQLLSGATLKALDDRGAYRANDSASQFYNALTGGQVSSPATSQAASATNAFGSSQAAGILGQGDILAQLAAAKNANWGTALNGAAGALGGWLK